MKFNCKLLSLTVSLMFSLCAFAQLPTDNEVREINAANDVKRMPSTRFNTQNLLAILKKRAAGGATEVRFQIANNGKKDTVYLVPNEDASQSNVVRYPINRLIDILQGCVDNNNPVIRFHVAGFTQADVDRYVANHPETSFSDDDKAALLQKKTILIRVPKSVIAGAEISSAGGSNEALVDMGKICPPPPNCEQ